MTKGGLVSSFFFFRSDPRRNNHSALVPVIAHGFVTTIPSCRDFINQRISDDPKILEARLEDQFRELVVQPCLQQGFASQVLRSDAAQGPSVIAPVPGPSAVARDPSGVAQEASQELPIPEDTPLRLYQRWWRLVRTSLFPCFAQNGGPHREEPYQGLHLNRRDVDATTQGVSRLDVSTQEDYPENLNQRDGSVREENSAWEDVPSEDVVSFEGDELSEEDLSSEEEQEDGLACTDGPTLVIIDGLDECGGEAAQRRILSTILSAFQRQPQLSLKFLICSRPEAWIREAFSSKPLSQLSHAIVLDESFMPNRDIRHYYRHHFHKITNSPKYNHVQFPTPWPSEDDLDDLVERSDGQFVHAATTVKFIDSQFKHPITQLHLLLQETPRRQPGSSPYQQLDALYDYILGINPDYEEVRPILAAIILFPPLARTPACIELLLELPAGQVAVTLRGMHSVMDIGRPDDIIRLFHTSFSDYLVDRTRSGRFFIDTDVQRYVITRQWLRKLTIGKVRTYR
ncbi:hypothetical protein AAF712_011583 [Marasmius tenuissimus]|uniref:Nephrocystin 3-like N-terminal domain-containing protein n=1 Tax=Marasmius tenuissimus TaxID=585030 RepID=A0ABR2ZMB3_9AGAR